MHVIIIFILMIIFTLFMSQSLLYCECWVYFLFFSNHFYSINYFFNFFSDIFILDVLQVLLSVSIDLVHFVWILFIIWFCFTTKKYLFRIDFNVILLFLFFFFIIRYVIVFECWCSCLIVYDALTGQVTSRLRGHVSLI